MSLSTITPANRAEWLEERRKGIGASEAAAALGVSPFESPRGLYLRKIGVMPDAEETEAMRWGTLLEPVIAAEYERRTGNRVVAQQVFRRFDLPTVPVETPLFATLDGLTEAGHPVEFKAVGAWSGRTLGEEESDQVPDHWLIQSHHQMVVSGADRVDFAVLVAGQSFRLFTVTRDERLLRLLLESLAAFWGRVLHRVAPPESCPADARLLHLIYPGCDGEVELGEEAAEDVLDWEIARAAARGAQGEADRFKAHLLERLGNAASGRLPDGRVLTRKVIEVAASTVERKAYTRVDLRIKGPGG